MKGQQKRVGQTTTTTSSSLGNNNNTNNNSNHQHQQIIGTQGSINEKSNFSKAVANLVAQKQKKAQQQQQQAGQQSSTTTTSQTAVVSISHKNSLPDNTINISQEQINQLNHFHHHNLSHSNPMSTKLNNKSATQQQQTTHHFRLPSAHNNNQNNIISQTQPSQNNYQQQNQTWNLSTSLNKSNILDTSYGGSGVNNCTTQPIYSMSTSNQQTTSSQVQTFSGQKFNTKNSVLIGNHQQAINNNNTFQQTRPSNAQQKLNYLLEQTKDSRSSPTPLISQTDYINSSMNNNNNNNSLNGNQKQYFNANTSNNNYIGQQQFNQSYNNNNPSSTLPVYQNQKTNNVYHHQNSNTYHLNNSTNHTNTSLNNNNVNNNSHNVGQVWHTLQDGSPIRKTRQSLELRTRPLHTEGNVYNGGQNVSEQLQFQIQQDQQILSTTNNNNNHSPLLVSSQAQPPHYMLSKPNSKPYATRIYKSNKTSILSKNDTLNTSKERPLSSQQQNMNQILQQSLIESNRNNSYLAGSAGKSKPQQYFQLNSFNHNTQPASRSGGNAAISPAAISRADNYNKNTQSNGFYNNNNINSSLQSNYHPLNTFLNPTQNMNSTSSGSTAQVIIQQAKEKINQTRHMKDKQQSNSIGGNISQNNSLALNSLQQSSFIHNNNNGMSGINDHINTSGIQNNNNNSIQNQNSVKSSQHQQQNQGGVPPQPQQYHHQKNSKSMTINKNSFIANFNIQSPIGNTTATQINLNTSKESTDYSFLHSNHQPHHLLNQISQSPSIHSIQKKPKIQINNLNNSITSSQQQQQMNLPSQQQQQSNSQQFQQQQQPRAQTQASSRREQDTQKSVTSNQNRQILSQLQQSSASQQLIEDQTNLSNITTNFITLNEKSSPVISAKIQQDSFRFYDEVLEEFIQKNRYANENKLDYFENFLMTLNEISRRSQVNQKLNFSQQQQQQQQYQQNMHFLQQQQHLNIASQNTAASLYQNSTQYTSSNRFFENLKQILELPIQGLLQECRHQQLDFEQKKSQIARELDLERKERAVLEMKIDILEQEKDKLQNLATTLSKQQQVNSQKSRNMSTNSHTNSHNTSHNNTSNFINVQPTNNSNPTAIGFIPNNTNNVNNNSNRGTNLTQQEIQMLLAENDKLKNIAKKQKKQMSTNRQKEEKLMKLLYAIRKHGINVDEIYNDNVKTPDSLSPSTEQQNRYQNKPIDFISPEHNHFSQFQPWELSQDHNHNISQNANNKNNQQQNELQQPQQQTNNGNIQQVQQGNNSNNQQNNQQKPFLNKKAIKRVKKGNQSKLNQSPFYVNSQDEDSEENYNENDGDEDNDDEYQNDFSDDDNKNNEELQDNDNNNFDADDYQDDYERNQNKVDQNNHQNYNQFNQNKNELSWQGGDSSTVQSHQFNLIQQLKQNTDNQLKNKFQKNNTNFIINTNKLDKSNQQQGRYSNYNNEISENQKDIQQQYDYDNNSNEQFNQQQYHNNNLVQNNFMKNQNYQDNSNIINQNQFQSNYQQNNNHIDGNMKGDDQFNSEEKSVSDSESDVLSIPVNEIAYASQSNKMINPTMKNQLKINLGCLQVNNPSNNNNMNLNLGKIQQNGDINNQQQQIIDEERFDYHDEFMNKFDEFSQSWRDAINEEKKRYQNNATTPISHIYATAI